MSSGIAASPQDARKRGRVLDSAAGDVPPRCRDHESERASLEDCAQIDITHTEWGERLRETGNVHAATRGFFLSCCVPEPRRPIVQGVQLFNRHARGGSSSFLLVASSILHAVVNAQRSGEYHAGDGEGHVHRAASHEARSFGGREGEAGADCTNLRVKLCVSLLWIKRKPEYLLNCPILFKIPNPVARCDSDGAFADNQAIMIGPFEAPVPTTQQMAK